MATCDWGVVIHTHTVSHQSPIVYQNRHTSHMHYLGKSHHISKQCRMVMRILKSIHNHNVNKSKKCIHAPLYVTRWTDGFSYRIPSLYLNISSPRSPQIYYPNHTQACITNIYMLSSKFVSHLYQWRFDSLHSHCHDDEIIFHSNS